MAPMFSLAEANNLYLLGIIFYILFFSLKILCHYYTDDQVKGYINEMAMRLEDEDERISSLAKLFFHELSKKGIV